MQDKTNNIDKVRDAGLYAKGSVYILLGVLSLMAALGIGGKISGASGVSDFLVQLPAGNVLLAVTGLGLLAYAAWRLYEALEDPKADPDETRPGRRAYYIYSALVYGFLAFTFVRELIGSGSSGGGGDKEKAILASLLEQDAGTWIVGLIALVVAVQALWQFYMAFSKRFMKKIHIRSHDKSNLIEKAGQGGYSARGVVFGILAFFLYKVMTRHSAQAYQGTEGAMEYLLSFSYGKILLAAVAAGLACYGIFNIMVGRYSSLQQLK